MITLRFAFLASFTYYSLPLLIFLLSLDRAVSTGNPTLSLLLSFESLSLSFSSLEFGEKFLSREKTMGDNARRLEVVGDIAGARARVYCKGCERW